MHAFSSGISSSIWLVGFVLFELAKSTKASDALFTGVMPYCVSMTFEIGGGGLGGLAVRWDWGPPPIDQNWFD